MYKFLSKTIGVCGFVLNLSSTGNSTNFRVEPDIISFKQNEQKTKEITELLPVLKEIGREDLKNRFNYASKKLIEIIKSDKRICDIADIEKIKKEVQIRKNFLEDDNPRYLYTGTFTTMPIVLILNNNEEVNDENDTIDIKKALRNVQDFILMNYKLREAFWHVPANYETKNPTLDFVPDQVFMYRNSPSNGILDENILCLLMAGIEGDLRANHLLRGDDVSENTRQLFKYFLRCKNNDNNIVEKILAYQKYLTPKQNSDLTLQLLSVYIKDPGMYNCKEYIIQLTKQFCYNVDYKNIVLSIDQLHKTTTGAFQKFLRYQLRLHSEYNSRVNNFVSKALDTQTFEEEVEEGEKKIVSLHKLCDKKLNDYIKQPIIDKFLRYRKNLKKKQSGYFFESFINTMCKGNAGILKNTLDFFDLYALRKIRKTMFVPQVNNG